LKEQQLRPDLAQAKAALYCWDNGSVHSFYNGYKYPNGVCLSGDGRFLYTSSNKTSEAFINEFDAATLAFVRVVTKENSDGIKCDRYNNFFLANKEGVLIINKEGKRIGLISLPTAPANLCWGGREGNDLFITARENIFLIPNLQRDIVV
jgi:gluconolactonase